MFARFVYHIIKEHFVVVVVIVYEEERKKSDQSSLYIEQTIREFSTRKTKLTMLKKSWKTKSAGDSFISVVTVGTVNMQWSYRAAQLAPPLQQRLISPSLGKFLRSHRSI